MNKYFNKSLKYIIGFTIFILYLVFARVLFLDIFPGPGVNPVKKIDAYKIQNAIQTSEISHNTTGLSQKTDSMRQWCTYSNTLTLGDGISLKPKSNAILILHGDKNSYYVDLKTEQVPENKSVYAVTANFSTHKIGPGVYRTGILISDDKGKDYINWESYTNKKRDDIILKKYLGRWVENLSNPEQISTLNYFIDGAKNITVDDESYLSVFGWIFINDMNTNNQQVFVEIEDQTGNKRYRQAIAPLFRPGFEEYFKSPLYTMAGFEADIEAEELRNSDYRIRIIVKNGDKLVTHTGYYNFQYNAASVDLLPITKVESQNKP